MTGFSWLLVAVGASAHPTEFQLDTDTPDALCPELSMTREAVRQRLGQLETETGADWRGSYSTVHDPSGRRGDYVRLVIRDAAGKEHLERELPLKGASCDTLAQAIALVVDGFFRELAQSSERDATTTPSLQQPGAVSSAPPPTAAAAPEKGQTGNQTTPLPFRASNAPAVRSKKGPSAGLAFGTAYESVPSKPALDLGAFFRPTPHWQLQLRTALPFSGLTETRERGAATTYPVPLRLSLSYLVEPVERVQWFVGPHWLTSLERAATIDAPNGRSGWRASIGLGAQTGMALWLTPTVAIAASASIEHVFFQSRKFLMYEQPVLELERTRVSATLGLWVAFWP